jgi:S-adenosylmethionine decarboxylase
MYVDRCPIEASLPFMEPLLPGCRPMREAQADHFVRRDGKLYAGTHLILDLWGARHLDRRDIIETAMRDAVQAAGATLLHIHLHRFTPGGGISGVAVLAESHISVHTWPERGFAAFDLFMCGAADPSRCIPVLERAFRPQRTVIAEQLRGLVDDHG